MSSTNSENRRLGNQVTIANDDPKFKIKKQAAVQVALAALSHLKYTRTHLSLIFTSDLKIKLLNRRFLKHDRPTDVLAFPLRPPFLGEVIISPKRASVQASIYEASFQEELARYICHGILHLAGFKDKTRKDQNQMRRQENIILKRSKKHLNRII